MEKFKQSLDNASQDDLGRLKKTVSDVSSHADTIDMMCNLAATEPVEAPNDVSPETKQPPKKKSKREAKKPQNNVGFQIIIQ